MKQGAEIIHCVFNLEWTLISVVSLFVVRPQIRGVIINLPIENATKELVRLQETEKLSHS